MDEKLSAALAKRLAAYSATAGVALATAPAAGAQVVYHDLDPDAVVQVTSVPDVFPLDLDDDGVVDVELLACSDVYPNNCPSERRRLGRRQRAGRYGRYYFEYRIALNVPSGADVRNGAVGYDFFDCASRLGTGAAVGPVQRFYRYALVAYSDYSYGPYCPFVGEEGYAGFRFIAGDGQLHYGWIRLAASDNATSAAAYEYAYEAAPETPIAAGAISDVVLTGSVNQTAFPSSGGTLRYTFTTENITLEPLPLDLWFDHYRLGAGPGRTRLLGSGTLPPRARVTRTVEVELPAIAPAGDYEVEFKLGDFDAGVFLTFQRFVITKAPPALGGEGQGDPLAATPIRGDLFASANAAVAAGTHALSAPSPNPSDGRTSLTLQVAEPQHVRVEVLDGLGRRVALLHDGPMAAGAEHRLVFDGSALPVGVYVVRAVGEGFSDARVLTLTR